MAQWSVTYNVPDALVPRAAAAIASYIGPQLGGESATAYIKRFTMTMVIQRDARLQQDAAAAAVVVDNTLIT